MFHEALTEVHGDQQNVIRLHLHAHSMQQRVVASAADMQLQVRWAGWCALLDWSDSGGPARGKGVNSTAAHEMRDLKSECACVWQMAIGREQLIDYTTGTYVAHGQAAAYCWFGSTAYWNKRVRCLFSQGDDITG